MNRMDRMMAIVMALQQRPETAQSLADKLEVSKRRCFAICRPWRKSAFLWLRFQGRAAVIA